MAVAGPSSRVTVRCTRSARRMRSPGSSARTASGVYSTSGSCGPPVPSLRLVRSWPTTNAVPPGASAAAARARTAARTSGLTWR